MEQSKALSKPDFRHILADINWEHGSHLVLAAKRSDSQGLLLKSVPFTHNGERSLRALTADQKAFFQENGYLPYKRVVSDEELKALCQRTVDIIEGKLTHLPPRYIQLEKAFRDGNDTTTPRIDIVRKITRLCYFDDLFQAVATKPEIVDVIEELLGPNIKFFTDQLMMKSRFNGTVTDWHQDSPAWPYFVPQDHVSCWVALDDATVENGCMTVIPGSHKWGPVAREWRNRFLSDPEISDPVAVELKAGHCMFHHGLNFHRTGANPTPDRRRGLALHYIHAETKYLGIDNEDKRLEVECENPPGVFRFMRIRGKEFPGRV